MEKAKGRRAYYVGACKVGGHLLLVEPVGIVRGEYYELIRFVVKSKNSAAYRYGETFERFDHDIYDKASARGYHITHSGKAWKEGLPYIE